MDAPDLAKELAEPLASFESWAMIDDRGTYTESISGGPLSVFFSRAQEDERYDGNISQIFLLWNPENPWAARAVEDVRPSLKGLHMPLFHFRDGEIILLASNEAGSLTTQRCHKHLSGLIGWRVLDSSGCLYGRSESEERSWRRGEYEDVRGFHP
jgi:hypothetical protein